MTTTMTRIPVPEHLHGFDIPAGSPVSMADLCFLAQIPLKVTGGYEPLILITPGDKIQIGRDRAGRRVYCLGARLLANDNEESDIMTDGLDLQSARTALALLAYGCFDYAARETMARWREHELPATQG